MELIASINSAINGVVWGPPMLILLVGALAATDFDRAFTVFHGIFFPGKDNWLFDPATDPVIVLLPEEFFRNCAIAIGVSLLGLCLLLLFTGRRQKK